MEKSKLRADLAVMNALRELDRIPGAVIDFDRLAQRWPEYGLRHSDLHDAVQRLASRGFVQVQGNSQRRRIWSTDLGREWAQSQPAWLEYSLLAPRREQFQLHQMPGFSRVYQSMERRARSFGPH